jgi:HD superfamily phosphohydrolase
MKVECPVHGSFKLDEVCAAIINTPEFQRLKDLKQLGLSSFFFQSAEHTRYPHSLGVAHLANQFVRILQAQQPELNITEREISCVTIAGLCHDLGHGPFSHTFDQCLLPRLGISEWYE